MRPILPAPRRPAPRRPALRLSPALRRPVLALALAAAATPAGAYLPPGLLPTLLDQAQTVAQDQARKLLEQQFMSIIDINTLIIELAQQNSANQVSRSMQLQTQSEGLLTDAKLRAETEQALQKEQLKAARDFAPSFTACQQATGARALAAASEHSAERRVSMGRALARRATNDPRGPSGQGTAVDVAYRFTHFGSTFCDPARYGEICTPGKAGAGLGGQAETNPFADADIQAASLFGRSSFTVAKAAPSEGNPSGDIERPMDETAATALVVNLIDPKAPEPLPIAILNSPAGRQQLMRRRAENARMDMARAALIDMVSRRIPTPLKDAEGNETPESGAWARAMLEQSGLPADHVPDRVSEHELMEILAARRFEGEAWYTLLQGAEPANVRRETAGNLALMLRLRWRTWQMTERLAAIRATRLAMRVEAARKPLPLSALPGSALVPAAGGGG